MEAIHVDAIVDARHTRRGDPYLSNQIAGDVVAHRGVVRNQRRDHALHEVLFAILPIKIVEITAMLAVYTVACPGERRVDLGVEGSERPGVHQIGPQLPQQFPKPEVRPPNPCLPAFRDSRRERRRGANDRETPNAWSGK